MSRFYYTEDVPAETSFSFLVVVALIAQIVQIFCGNVR